MYNRPLVIALIIIRRSDTTIFIVVINSSFLALRQMSPIDFYCNANPPMFQNGGISQSDWLVARRRPAVVGRGDITRRSAHPAYSSTEAGPDLCAHISACGVMAAGQSARRISASLAAAQAARVGAGRFR